MDEHQNNNILDGGWPGLHGLVSFTKKWVPDSFDKCARLGKRAALLPFVPLRAGLDSGSAQAATKWILLPGRCCQLSLFALDSPRKWRYTPPAPQGVNGGRSLTISI